jgi:anti-sigma regulatory factor (Ser/Thr protein kinase)
MASQEPIESDGRRFYATLPNTALGAVRARKKFLRFISSFGVRGDLQGDIEIVIGEALANAAEHGYKHRGIICVEALLTDEHLEASITDDGPGFLLRGPISAEHPPAHSPRGFGLFLMQALVEELEFRNDGRTVWFRKVLPPGAIIVDGRTAVPAAPVKPLDKPNASPNA